MLGNPRPRRPAEPGPFGGIVQQRLEDVDIDDLIDEVGNYLRKNPEVLVVSLGAVTIAAGALVFLNRRGRSS